MPSRTIREGIAFREVAPSPGSPTPGDAGPMPESVTKTGASECYRRSRFRIGRWFLLLEGILVAELAGVALEIHGAPSIRGSAGFTFSGLTLTPMRSGLLLAFGVVAVVATLNRRATMIVTAAALAISLTLTALGDVALAAGLPHQWGVDPHNAGLFAVLVVYNFALLVWLFPDLFERPAGALRERDDIETLSSRK